MSMKINFVGIREISTPLRKLPANTGGMGLCSCTLTLRVAFRYVMHYLAANKHPSLLQSTRSLRCLEGVAMYIPGKTG